MSLALLAVSVCPEAPIPQLRGRGRYLLAFSSKASRTKAAIDVRRSAAMTLRRFNKSSGMEIVVRSMLS